MLAQHLPDVAAVRTVPGHPTGIGVASFNAGWREGRGGECAQGVGDWVQHRQPSKAQLTSTGYLGAGHHSVVAGAVWWGECVTMETDRAG